MYATILKKMHFTVCDTGFLDFLVEHRHFSCGKICFDRHDDPINGLKILSQPLDVGKFYAARPQLLKIFVPILIVEGGGGGKCNIL
jgi:hypothetical protein